MALRVGIISANWGAMAHLPAWRAVPGVEVTAICTSRRETAEAAAERYKIDRPFWDAEAMIADPDIDIIDCGTRPAVRRPMVLSALRQGKHVYNGIPFAADLDQARSLYEAWRGSDSVAIVDAFSQWVPSLQRAKEMIDEGFLGQPFGGSSFFNMGLFNQQHPQFPYNWFAQGGLGVSAVRNLGSHALHLLVSMFGEVEELVADDRQLLSEWTFTDGSVVKAENNDFANVILRFANGMTMPMQISWNATVGKGWSLEAFGSKGRINASDPSFPTSQGCGLLAGAIGSNTVEPVEIPDRLMRPSNINIGPEYPVPPAHPMAISMERMVRAINGDGTAAPDFAQAWHVERIQEAIRRSSLERRWVALEEVV